MICLLGRWWYCLLLKYLCYGYCDYTLYKGVIMLVLKLDVMRLSDLDFFVYIANGACFDLLVVFICCV